MADSNTRLVVITLRLAAAQAEKLANDVENNQLWSRRDFDKAISNAQSALTDAARHYRG